MLRPNRHFLSGYILRTEKRSYVPKSYVKISKVLGELIEHSFRTEDVDAKNLFIKLVCPTIKHSNQTYAHADIIQTIYPTAADATAKKIQA